jgi:hypothetical protein
VIEPVFDESQLPERLRNLLAMEIDRIATDLEWRQRWLLELWSRHRDRGPFLDTIFSRWRTLSMADLALIDLEAMTACEAFHHELDELRLYFQFTQDMPTTMEAQYAEAVRRIRAFANLAIQLLGGVPNKPIVDFDTARASAPPPEAFRLAVEHLGPTEPEPETVIGVDGARPADSEGDGAAG